MIRQRPNDIQFSISFILTVNHPVVDDIGQFEQVDPHDTSYKYHLLFCHLQETVKRELFAKYDKMTHNSSLMHTQQNKQWICDRLACVRFD